MDSNPLYTVFRDYDIRGVYDAQLTPNFALQLGKAFGTYLKGSGNVCVGRDIRRGGKILEDNFVIGLLDTGCNVTLIGQVPIGLSNFAVWKGNYIAGMYITASHNPPNYNGFRFRYPDGTGFTEENKEIRDIFFSNEFISKQKGSVIKINSEIIVKDYWSLISRELQNLGELKIGIDPGNGGASKIAGDLIEKSGHNVIRINDFPDENYPNRSPHNKDSEIGELKSLVVEQNCDFGVAFDGDGDRCVFVDNLGRTCQTEKILIFLAIEMKTTRNKEVVVSMPCSTILERELEPLGIKIVRSKVGDVNVSKVMKKNNAMLGGEVSSHIFISDYYFFDDSILATIKLANSLLRKKVSLNKIIDSIKSYPFEQTFVPCPDDKKFQVVDMVKNQFLHLDFDINALEGVRISDDKGWSLVRGSNTEPIIKVIVEGKNNQSFEEKKEEIFEVLEKQMNSLNLEMKLIEGKNA
jgi:phosphomannomutase/phosphoglucomutase